MKFEKEFNFDFQFDLVDVAIKTILLGVFVLCVYLACTNTSEINSMLDGLYRQVTQSI